MAKKRAGPTAGSHVVGIRDDAAVAIESKDLAEHLRASWSSDGLEQVTSPKQPPFASDDAPWCRYYAGYADEFVADVIATLPDDVGTVLDPWNGSGTTTRMAAEAGFPTTGFDLNPTAVVIAKARLLRSDVASSIVPLTKELLASIEDVEVDCDDLLLDWMTPRAVRAVRRLSDLLARALGPENEPTRGATWYSALSSLAAVFYLGLFRVTREALREFVGTNPTWFRQRVDPVARVDLDLRTLRPAFIAAMSDLAEVAAQRGISADGSASAVGLAASSDLPLSDGAANVAITSPPYCTRIDYAVATLPELASLGLSRDDFRNLRDRLIGTPTLNADDHEDAEPEWGETVNVFLQQVSGHSSRASSTYYRKFFEQYFGGMWASLGELDRVLDESGAAVIVVQDSYYKDIHADIPAAIVDMGARLSWSLLGRADFEVRTKAYINGRARKYREDRMATESVLVLGKV